MGYVFALFSRFMWWSPSTISTDYVVPHHWQPQIHVDATCRGAYVTKIEGTPSRLVEWILTVPRLLWELGTRDLVFTEVGSVGVVLLNGILS